MKDQINKLTEAQAKELLIAAMRNYETSVYAEEHYRKMQCAENLGAMKMQIETLAKTNKQ
jgi:hypothetical protein